MAIVGAVVAVAGATVGEGIADGGITVVVGSGVSVMTVAVGVMGVNESVGAIVAVTEVGEGSGEAVGVITIGLPNSRHPRSGAAPIKPVRGLGGTSSPLAAAYWETPLSMAGDVPCSRRPLKSSSTVSQVPSGPGFGFAAKSGSWPLMIPTPSVV